MKHPDVNRMLSRQANLFRVCLTVLFVWIVIRAGAQQIIWAKVYPLEKIDQISCLTRDVWGDLYAGGYTRRNVIGGSLGNAIVYKLEGNGDTLFSRYLNIKGDARSIVIDPHGMVLIGVRQYDTGLNSYNTIFCRMTPEGFVFQWDTININLTIHSSIIGKDSSWIMVGETRSATMGGWRDMFFQRIQKDGTIDPLITLNQGHPDFTAHRVEQLPNGHYLMSGHMGSRIVSYELDEFGQSPVFRQWYQTPNLTNLYSGHISRINGQRYMIAAQGNPSIIGQYDSLLQKYWLKKDEGNQIPPQVMLDGSVVVGYRSGLPPYQSFFRIGADSLYIWNMTFRDSLLARGLSGNLDLYCFTYFDDQSAVVAGVYEGGITTTTQSDPFLMKIANVGTPVTSLSKPKKGPLQNETLAPWPNPSSGTLYMKQHFDKAEVRFYNLSGKEMAQYQIRFGQPIELSALPPGLYLYRAVIDGKSYSGKVVKR
jgi:hypothetical protein